MSAKIDLLPLLERQLATFQGYSRRTALLDAVTFAGVPIGGAIAIAIFERNLHVAGAAIGAIGVFTALLFALLVNVFNLSVKLKRDEAMRPEHTLVRNVDELFTNVAWSAVVGLTLVTVLVAISVTHSDGARLGAGWTFVAAALFIHLVVTVLMAIARIWSAHEAIGELSPRTRPSTTDDGTHRNAA